tara:strand:- start:665 stop:1432 length:768 start_codon:yes stop_codon:yes gene_type:complete
MSTALSSTNLFLLLRPLRHKLPLYRIIHIDLLSLLGAYYTPGGIGGIGIIVYMMSRNGINIKDASIVVLINKIISLFVILFFFTIYLLIYPFSDFDTNWELLFFFIIFLVLMALSFFSKLVRDLIKSVLIRIYTFKNHYRVILLTVFLTIGVYFLNVLCYITCFYAVGISIPDFHLIFLTYSIFMIINYLPISFGGIGIGEVAAIVLWSTMGLSTEQILSGFIVVRGFTLISSLSLSGLAFFFFPNNIIKKIKRG